MSEFDRIAGYKEEKEELISLSELIKNREKLYEIGGRLPRGLGLVGPNGVGKTILAKCFIKESQCKCVSIDYNEIENDDGFAAYLKQKFAEAASDLPCILFIDELDKLVGHGPIFLMDDSFDKSRILLSEINRYSGVEGLFLLVCANERYNIDSSLVRSGRLDKTIKIDYPNDKERLDIIHYYLRNKKTDDSIDYDNFTKMTRDCSGADIETLINDSIIKAFSNHRDYITYSDIIDCFYKSFCESLEKESPLDEENLRVIAYHEGGHAVLNYLTNASELNYITILPRSNSRGYVHSLVDESKITTFLDMEQNIQVCLAGIASEELFANTRSMGGGMDLSQAKKLASALVRRHAYSGFEYLIASSDHGPSFDSDNVSDARIREAEIEEDKLLNNMFAITKKLLLENKDLVDAIVEELLKKKILNKEQINEVLEKKRGSFVTLNNSETTQVEH